MKITRADINHYIRKKKRLRRKKIKELIQNTLIAITSLLIFMMIFYIGFDYAAYKADQENQIRMEKQAEWRRESDSVSKFR